MKVEIAWEQAPRPTTPARRRREAAPVELGEPEYASVLVFVQHCLDDEQETFTPGDAQKIAEQEHRSTAEVLRELQSWGLRAVVQPSREVRGFTTSSHDRWYGKGSESCSGGSGWEQIAGFAGREGQ